MRTVARPGARSYVYPDESKEIPQTPDCQRRQQNPARCGTGGRYQRLRQPAATGAERYRTAGKPLRFCRRTRVAVSRLSVLINCRTARKSACFDVTKGDLIAAINKGCHTVAALKAETKAGTGCGGCIPLVTSGTERGTGETGHRS